MDHFAYHHGTLYAEHVPLETIAAEIGTPFYCYSSATLERHYQVFSEGLTELNPLVCYAMKANGNLSVLRTFAQLGAGADVVSEGEIRLALAAGIPADKIVFSGVGKTPQEMAFALDQKIFQFNVESFSELVTLAEVAEKFRRKAPVAIRVNPDVDPQTHAKISTGKKETKFGVPFDEARRMYHYALDVPSLKMQGVSVHIGSQLTSLEPFRLAFQRVRAFTEELRLAGHPIEVVDLGGGLGIPYEADQQAPPLPEKYGEMVANVMRGLKAKYVFEPGRLLVGNAGVLVSQVIYVKQHGRHVFVIADAAMNDLMRPSLYNAHHDIVPVRDDARALIQADIVGPVCETSDIFASARLIPEVRPGELIAFRSAGAYGASMSSTYNARPLIPEVLVKEDQYAVVRPRQTYEDLIGRDRLAEWLG